MIYLQLFLSFLKIGAFSFGGGYAAMPMIQQQVVDAYHWLSVSEFGDLVTISQMTPGPIAINAATFVGIRVVGWQGSGNVREKIDNTLMFKKPNTLILDFKNVSFMDSSGIGLVMGRYRLLKSINPSSQIEIKNVSTTTSRM